MDLFSRKIISWNLSGKLDVSLVLAAFQKAYNLREQPDGLMFHSDRGTQYTAGPFRKLLDDLNVVQSFSKKVIPSITPAAKASSNISKKKKPIEEPITLYKNCS